jgi:hypothetical protein
MLMQVLGFLCAIGYCVGIVIFSSALFHISHTEDEWAEEQYEKLMLEREVEHKTDAGKKNV